MRIFITGASGYVGSVVTEKALKAGHEVIGLARSAQSAEKIRKLGGKPLLATLEDAQKLADAAREADAVLHLGFVHEFDRPFEELIAIDTRAIQAMGKALAGSHKAFVTTSGTALVQSDNGKETPEDFPLREGHLSARGRAEQETTGLADIGVRAMVIRLAPYVYGRGGSYFVPMNIQAAAKYGFAPYVGDGNLMTTAADVDASAELYLLAMEKGEAGSVFNCSTETDLQIKQLAEAIATALGVKTKSVSAEQAGEMLGQFTAMFQQLENRASSAKACRELGWAPKPQYNVCDDIVRGSYKPLVEQLKREVKAVR
jgi:nucleoside-diphosphate-sugar epimerase